MKYNDIYMGLLELLKKSYSPYSNYPVAAYVDTDLGFISGVNVENGSFGLTSCAERNAIFNAIANGAKTFKTVYIITKNNGDIASPCGACRQVIFEFFKKDAKIVVFNHDGTYKEYNVEQLLPFGWDPNISL